MPFTHQSSRNAATTEKDHQRLVAILRLPCEALMRVDRRVLCEDERAPELPSVAVQQLAPVTAPHTLHNHATNLEILADVAQLYQADNADHQEIQNMANAARILMTMTHEGTPMGALVEAAFAEEVLGHEISGTL
ncbi:hypothetical protein NX059_000896 [Plenodomus lindquistii]|nr:hypothetical protein NX059_000896 [Plenodomus lindquistii]